MRAQMERVRGSRPFAKKGNDQIGRRISGVLAFNGRAVSGVRSGQLRRFELAVGLAETVG